MYDNDNDNDVVSITLQRRGPRGGNGVEMRV